MLGLDKPIKHLPGGVLCCGDIDVPTEHLESWLDVKTWKRGDFILKCSRRIFDSRSWVKQQQQEEV